MLQWLAKIWLTYFDSAWNRPPAWVESWFYDKTKGRACLAVLRSHAPDVHRISSHMKSLGFKWTSDPLGGKLDFTSTDWVTCARGEGDCDDWAILWYQILRHHGKVERMYTKKKGGGAHAMTVFTKGTCCYLLSNLGVLVEVSEAKKDVLLTKFYGIETDFSVLY